MRRSLAVFLLLLLLLLGFALHAVWPLLGLLFEDAAVDAIHRSELPAPNSTRDDLPPQKIPKIIHQTYINASIPALWVPSQQACIDLHPDYEYILWSDAKSLEFIAKEYPWFLQTFKGYKYPIQRADTIRYFVLVHYGGIYIDLDDGCRRSLDPLLTYEAWLRRTIPTGISNDLMGSVPRHPFFLHVIESLQAADRKWVLPYITIMASTGPLFLSVVWKRWMSEHAHQRGQDYVGRVRVLLPDMIANHDWSFFQMVKGSSWHGSDAKFIFWMGKHWAFLTFAGFAVACTVFTLGWWLYRRLVLWVRRRAAQHGHSNVYSWANGRLSAWRKWSGRAGGRSKGMYELLEQHES